MWTCSLCFLFQLPLFDVAQVREGKLCRLVIATWRQNSKFLAQLPLTHRDERAPCYCWVGILGPNGVSTDTTVEMSLLPVGSPEHPDSVRCPGYHTGRDLGGDSKPLFLGRGGSSGLLCGFHYHCKAGSASLSASRHTSAGSLLACASKGEAGYFLQCLAQMKLLFPKNFLSGQKGLFPGPLMRENRVLWENSVLIAISNFFFKNYFLIEIQLIHNII